MCYIIAYRMFRTDIKQVTNGQWDNIDTSLALLMSCTGPFAILISLFFRFVYSYDNKT